MKKFSLRARGGFTLVELLVVISIIALLAGLSLSVTQGALAKARKVQAQVLLKTMQTGILAYQAEYGRLPLYEVYYPAATASAKDVELNPADNEDRFKMLVQTLTGSNIVSTGRSTNPRGIPFCEFQNKQYKGGSSSSGIVVSPFKTDKTPFYKPVYVALDYDGNNQINYKTESLSNDLPTSMAADVNAAAAVWCYGNAASAAEMKPADLISTW